MRNGILKTNLMHHSKNKSFFVRVEEKQDIFESRIIFLALNLVIIKSYANQDYLEILI